MTEGFTTRRRGSEKRVFGNFFSLPRRLVVILAFFIASGMAAAQPRSGYDDAGPQVRAMQDDDTQNPAFLWVEQGRALWAAKAGTDNKSCADCHGGLPAMKGVAARYPAWDQARRRAVSLPERVNLCRTWHQGAPKLDSESDALLALTAAIGLQSRGMPLAAPDPRLADTIAEGAFLFRRRMGQLDLSCAQCHDARAGQKLGGAAIPEGHANGYPEYRLEWQGMGSFARRLRACLAGVRAEPFAPDSAEAVALETFLAARAQGLKVETPAVRP